MESNLPKQTTKSSSNHKQAENIGTIVAKIEEAKQATALAQIDATAKNNEKEFEFAKIQENNKLEKWNKSLYIGVVGSAVMLGVSLYLILSNNDKSLGLGLLSSTITGIFGFIAGNGNCSNQ